MKNHSYIALLSAPLLFAEIASAQNRQRRADSYPDTGKVIRTTVAHRSMVLANSNGQQIDWDEPVMFLQTEREVFELHDVARRRFHPLSAGSTWHFRLSKAWVCVMGVPGKKPNEEQCYLIEGREVRQ